MATRTMINQIIKKYKELNNEYAFMEHIDKNYKNDMDLNFMMRDVRELYYYTYVDKEPRKVKLKIIKEMIKKMADNIDIY